MTKTGITGAFLSRNSNAQRLWNTANGAVIRRIVLLLALINVTYFSFSQNTESAKKATHFSGSFSATNNGISIVPSFSLSKPAAIFMGSIGKNRLSFDPDIRFSMAGKPWSFLFWGRYKIVSTNKFKMNAGAHLGLNFKTSILPVNTDTSEVTITRRYIAGELFPRYSLTKNISVGIYYLYSNGLDAGTIGNTHFVTFNTHFSNIKLPKGFYLRINPQFYYLKLDAQDGFYVTSTFTIARKNWPIAVSSTMNKIVDTDITGGKDFVWNVSLVYSFNKKYVQQ